MNHHPLLSQKPIQFVLLFLILLIGKSASAQTDPSDCGCDYTIPERQHITDGVELGIQPGDVICLQAGLKYNALVLLNIVGTAENPIIIKNCGGKVLVDVSTTFAFKTQYSKHFRITGTGDPAYEHGIELVGGSQGLTLDYLSTNFEVDHLEIHDQSFAGIMAKTDPYCDIPSTRDKFTMEDIRIHDNYIHETRGEGIYIGNSFFAEGMKRKCGRLMPHEIHGVKVYNNIVKNTGWDGIQVGSATQGAEIYNNRVENTGLRKISRHGHGIQLGEGTGGKCYNNVVSNVYWNGIQVLGYGDNLIYNNLIVNPGNNGSFIDSRMPATPGPGFNFIHNTIVNPGANGVMIFATDDHLQNKVLNNLIVNTGTYQEYEDKNNWKSGKDSYVLKHSVNISNTAIEGNYGTQDIAKVMFEDALNGNYHLQSTSPAINYGVDISKLGISLNTALVGRLIGDGYDAGAYEYGERPEPVPNQAPVAKAGNDKVISTTQVTLEGKGSSDPDGEIVRYHWKKLSGPGTVEITNPGVQNTTVKNLKEGEYLFELRVKDNKEAEGTDQVKVSVTLVTQGQVEPGSGNIKYSYYEGSWSRLPDFKKLNPVSTGNVDDLDISIGKRNDNFGLNFEGYIKIPKSGNYTFELRSDDGSKLYIGGSNEANLIVDNDGIHAPAYKQGTIKLEEGIYPFNVQFFENKVGEVLELYWKNTAHGVSSRQRVPKEFFVAEGSNPDEQAPVAEEAASGSIFVNFTQNLAAGTPWNNLNSSPKAGVRMANLKDAQGTSTRVSLTLLDNWGGIKNKGMNTGNNEGIYPDAVLQSYMWDASPNTRRMKISGLDKDLEYTITFMASKNGDGKLLTNYTINGQTVSLDASYNKNNTVSLNGIKANGNAELVIEVSKAQGSDYTYLNGINIQPKVVSSVKEKYAGNQLLVNFTHNLPEGAPWNNLNSNPKAGVHMANLKDAQGTETPISLTLLDNWGGIKNKGMNTGNNEGVYPDAVLQSYMWDASPNTRRMKISGLDKDLEYTITFMASKNGDGKLLTNYTINGQTVSLDASYNKNNTVSLNGIKADGNAEIVLGVSKGRGASYSYINGISIESNAADLRTASSNSIEQLSSEEEKVEVGFPYPNPFSSHLSMDIMVDKGKEIKILIHDFLGREVYNSGFMFVDKGLRNMRINEVNNFPGNTFYFLHVYFAHERVKSYRIFKQK